MKKFHRSIMQTARSLLGSGGTVDIELAPGHVHIVVAIGGRVKRICTSNSPRNEWTALREVERDIRRAMRELT